MARKFLSMIVFLLALMSLPAAPAKAQAPQQAQTNCEKLLAMDFESLADAPTAITAAERVEAKQGMAGFCKVSGIIAPQIQFELRLPDDWNRRYLQGGCGGFCGFIPIAACEIGQSRGFAVAASDLGHSTGLGPRGGPWVVPLWGADPNLRADFGGRATHALAIAAKAVIAAYYGSAPSYSYFQGCSTGGREGLQVAQNYPADFDGVIAGDPAFAGRLGGIWNNWMAHTLMTPANTPVFTPRALEVLHAAVTAACDGKDGLEDGIIEDSRQCSFDPGRLECAKAGGDDCLTRSQVQAARAMYDGARNSAGQRLYPGAAPHGSELDWNGPLMAEVTKQSLRFLAFSTPRPDFDYRRFDWDRDIDAVEAGARNYDPVAPRAFPRLSAFKERGGRLIAYHGSYDVGVPPDGMIDYYAQVWSREGGLDAARDWFRLFMVPGMFHCRGGGVPDKFDMLSAIVAWVEHGQAPDGVIATQQDAAGKPVRSRPLYAYPNVARYNGEGDPNDAASWHMQKAAAGDDRISWIWMPNGQK